MRRPVSVLTLAVVSYFLLQLVSSTDSRGDDLFGGFAEELFQPFSSFLQQPNEDDPDKTAPKTEGSPSDKPPTRTTSRRSRTTRDRAEMIKRAEAMRLASVSPMWGDFLGGLPFGTIVIGGGDGLTLGAGSAFPLTEGAAIAVRRIKLAENNSPVPMDRWIFGHNFFNDVTSIGDLNRYVFGLEKTYDDGLGSFEIRFPFVSGLDNDQSVNNTFDALTGDRATEFGDISLTWKRIVGVGDDFVATAGVGLRIPTGSDSSISNSLGEEIFRIEHDSVHLAPFAAILVKPDDKWFWQAFLQFDIVAGGNPITEQTGPLERTTRGILQDANLVFFDVGVGHKWIEDQDGFVKAITPMLELHYSSTTNDTDTANISFGADDFNLVGQSRRFDILNLTVAAALKINDRITVRPAMSFPLREGDDRLYDFEAGVQVNILR